MEWSKLKNIVLVLLLMTNGLLLVVVVGQEGELLKQERQARQSAIELLQSWGIALDEEIVPENITLQPLYLHRDQEKEARFASGLLGEGEVSTEKLSGDIFRYSGQNGAVQFHSEGELQIWLTPGSIQQEAELVTDDAKNRMQAWGMEGEVLLVEEENEGTTVILRQMIDGVPVLGCLISLRYQDGAISEIFQARWISGTPEEDRTVKTISVATALVNFRSWLMEQGDIFSKIISITPAYAIATSPAEEVWLVPVWRIETNTGVYQMNLLEGRIMSVSSD